MNSFSFLAFNFTEPTPPTPEPTPEPTPAVIPEGRTTTLRKKF